MGSDKKSNESGRRKLEDAVKANKGDVEDMVKAAYDVADEDPRGTLEIVDGTLDDDEADSDDDGRSVDDLMKKIKKKDKK